MSKLFAKRNIVDTWVGRNIVSESAASLARNDDLILRVGLEFGANGKLLRKAIIPTSDLGIFEIFTRVGDFTKEIFDIIDILEEFLVWEKGDKKEMFSRVLCAESPLYFHGQVTSNDIVLKIFGTGLHDLELKGSVRRVVEEHSFAYRVESLVNCFREFLNDLDNCIKADVFKGSYLLKQNALQHQRRAKEAV